MTVTIINASASNSLTSRQQRAATLLAGGMSGKETAKVVGVNAETVSRWRSIQAFEAAYNQARAELIQETKDGFLGLIHLSTEALRDILTKDTNTEKLKAVDLVLKASGAFQVEEPAPQTEPIHDDAGDLARFIAAVTGNLHNTTKESLD